MFKKSIKTFLFTLTIITSILSYTKPVFAQPPEAKCTGVDECAQLIYKTTLAILANVQDLPTLIEAWLAPDTSDATSTFQENFIKYINYTTQNDNAQIKLTNEYFMKDYFSDSLSYPNQMSYTTLLGAPFSPDIEKDKNGNSLDAYQLIKNAAGLHFQHAAPKDLGAWKGSDDAKQKYLAFYKSVSTASSFNAYILNGLYADYLNNFNLSNKQKELLQQATDTAWFEQIASEDIGIVLRQILMFNSQTYVMLLKLYETQKQQLAAQSIANTLLILNSYLSEKDLYYKAIGTSSTSTAPPPMSM
jgi:hypothetical protein